MNSTEPLAEIFSDAEDEEDLEIHYLVWLTVLIIVEAIASTLKKKFSKRSGHGVGLNIFIALLQLTEVVANVLGAALTMVRFASCGWSTVWAFGIAIVSMIGMWIVEGCFTLGRIKAVVPDEPFWNTFFESKVLNTFTAVVFIPYIIAYIRSFSNDRKCSSMKHVEAYTLIAYALLTGVPTFFIFFASNIWPGRIMQRELRGVLIMLVYVVMPLAFVIGLWVAVQPQLHILLDGVLLIAFLAPTLLFNWTKVKKSDTLLGAAQVPGYSSA